MTRGMTEMETNMDIAADMEFEEKVDAVDAPGDLLAVKIPSSTYLAVTGISVLASMALYFSGKKMASLFVGLWAPTILQMGIYNKLLRVSRGTAVVG